MLLFGFAPRSSVAASDAMALADERARLLLEQQLRRLDVGGGQSLGRWLQRDAARDARFANWVASLPRGAELGWEDGGAARVEASAADLLRVVREIAGAIPRADDPPGGLRVPAAAQERWGETAIAMIDESGATASFDLSAASRASSAQSIIESAAALRVSPADRLGGWLERRPQLREVVLANLPDAISIRVMPSGPYATIAASLELRALVEILESAVAEQPATVAAGIDFVDLFSLNEERTMVVETTIALPLEGAPPPALMRALTMPWAGRTLEAAGRAGVVEPSASGFAPMAAPRDSELLLEQAVFVAQQALRDQLMTLAHPLGGTLGAAAAQSVGIRRVLDSVIYFARAEGLPNWCDDGSVEVRLALPLDLLARAVDPAAPAGGRG